MASINKVMLIGNLGRDPEIRYGADGSAITNITVATTDTWKDKGGDKQERTEWHRVVFFNRLAEIAGEYLKKGSSVYVEGRLQTRKWQDKEGNERYTTEIVANEMKMLGSRSSGTASFDAPPESGERNSSPPRGGQASGGAKKGGSGFDDFEDDIPF